MVRQNVDFHGISYLSRLDSWQKWRELTDDFQMIRRKVGKPTGLISPMEYKMATTGTLMCPMCYGDGWLNTKQFGQAYCICTILDWMAVVANEIDPVESKGLAAHLESLDTGFHPTVAQMVTAVEAFIAEPGRWLVLSGNKGTGKTHALRAIATALSPIALYMTAGDFQSKMHQGREGGMSPTRITWVMEHAPILLFDDWGAQYDVEWIGTALRTVIAHRYELAREFPTVVSTNETPNSMLQDDERIYSRIVDGEFSTVLKMTGPDYRRMRARNGQH